MAHWSGSPTCWASSSGALSSGEISSEGSRFSDFPPMALSTRPFQERIPFWYPGDVAIEFGAGTPERIAERLAMLLEDGMADYICLMFPAADMTIDESRRTLELFVTEVQPSCSSPPSAPEQRTRPQGCRRWRKAQGTRGVRTRPRCAPVQPIPVPRSADRTTLSNQT